MISHQTEVDPHVQIAIACISIAAMIALGLFAILWLDDPPRR